MHMRDLCWHMPNHACCRRAEQDEELQLAHQSRLRAMVLDEVKQHFRPELLNRWVVCELLGLGGQMGCSTWVGW